MEAIGSSFLELGINGTEQLGDSPIIEIIQTVVSKGMDIGLDNFWVPSNS